MIRIDDAHLDLIYGLIRSSKPNKILELGYGTGASNRVIQKAIQQNQKGELFVVDNFYDWDYNKPDGFSTEGFNFIHSDESEFIDKCQDSFDFILADGDHNTTTLRVANLLNPKGILVVHDVCSPIFHNLHKIRLLGGMLFNTNSVQGEECDRGLLVFKASS